MTGATTRTTVSRTLRCLVSALLIAGCLQSQEPAPTIDWKADLATLASELPKRHKNPFTVITAEEFAERVQAAEARLKGLDDLRAAVELGLVVGAIRDSHTALDLPTLRESNLAARIWTWKDGYFAFQARKEHAAMLGKPIVKIGGNTMEAVTKRISELDPADNETYTRMRTALRLMQPRALWALGITDSPEVVPITVLEADGSERTFEVGVGQRQKDDALAAPAERSTTAQRPGWHQHVWLEDEGLLYIQFNSCSTSKEQDLDTFGDRMLEITGTGKVRALVIDLQYNGGGNSRLGDALFAKLAKNEPMQSKKNVFAIIGRQTFSSAILNAVSLKNRYGFVWVGTETGGSPNHFGELKTLTLPHSKLVLQYSTKRFDLGPPGATSLKPDHEVAPTFAEWRSGKDPVLELIRRLARD